MSRLYDRLMAFGYEATAADATMYRALGAFEALERAHVFVCDNVEEYWEQAQVRDLEELEKAIPKIISPISPAFYEAVPVGAWSRVISAYGALCVTHDLSTPDGLRALQSPVYNPAAYGMKAHGPGYGLPAQADDPHGARFLSEWWLFSERRIGGGNNRVSLFGLYCMPAKEDGSPFINELHPLRRTVAFGVGAAQDQIGQALTAAMRLMLPLYLAVSFMHCKNVATREVVPPSIVRQPWKKKHGVPMVRYHVLDIDPMRKVLRSEGGADEHGLQRALHICRGHFATYTDAAPLFGRLTGTFWRPQHVRGSAKEGVVLKDYRVKAPKPR